MTKYKCIIIDDEPLAHDVLNEYITSLQNIEVSASFFNPEDAGEYLINYTPDIMFLDIKMPGMDGITFLKMLVNKPVTIMTTANRGYALEGFDLGVMDYLIKPIKKERFLLAVTRAIEFIELQKNNISFLEQAKSREQNNFTIKSGTKLISLRLDSITHIQGLKDYAIVHTTDKKYVIKGYIKAIEPILPKGYFTRVHKSFIVANTRVKVINRSKIEFDNFQIPVGRSYREAAEALLSKG